MAYDMDVSGARAEYVSNSNRDDVLKVMYEFIEKNETQSYLAGK